MATALETMTMLAVPKTEPSVAFSSYYGAATHPSAGAETRDDDTNPPSPEHHLFDGLAALDAGNACDLPAPAQTAWQHEQLEQPTPPTYVDRTQYEQYGDDVSYVVSQQLHSSDALPADQPDQQQQQQHMHVLQQQMHMLQQQSQQGQQTSFVLDEHAAAWLALDDHGAFSFPDTAPEWTHMVSAETIAGTFCDGSGGAKRKSSVLLTGFPPEFPQGFPQGPHASFAGALPVTPAHNVSACAGRAGFELGGPSLLLQDPAKRRKRAPAACKPRAGVSRRLPAASAEDSDPDFELAAPAGAGAGSSGRAGRAAAAKSAAARASKLARSRTQSSQYRGVSRCSKDGRFQARIRVGARVIYLGRFKGEVSAARAYDEAAQRYHEKRAQLNFPLGAAGAGAGAESDGESTVPTELLPAP